MERKEKDVKKRSFKEAMQEVPGYVEALENAELLIRELGLETKVDSFLQSEKAQDATKAGYHKICAAVENLIKIAPEPVKEKGRVALEDYKEEYFSKDLRNNFKITIQNAILILEMVTSREKVQTEILEMQEEKLLADLEETIVRMKVEVEKRVAEIMIFD